MGAFDPDRDPPPPEPERAVELERDKRRAFEGLAEIGRALEEGRPAEMVTPARELLARVIARPDDGALAGFATMVLDASLWLIGGGEDRTALELGDALVARLGDGPPAQRAVAAGARFLNGQAYARLGRDDDARVQIEALCDMGEPALAALDRLAARFVASGADPAWHAQLAAASVTTLWRMGRHAEARAIADEAAASFARHGEPRLEGMLRALATELADRSEPGNSA